MTPSDEVMGVPFKVGITPKNALQVVFQKGKGSSGR